MQNPISELPVCKAVSTTVITVSPTMKLDEAARLFKQHDINAAPVVDGFGKCVGVLTSHHLVEFEANRIEIETQHQHGIAFNLARYGDGDSQALVGRPYDEVAYHMSTDYGVVTSQESLGSAGRTMCQKHWHHLVMLDDAERPAGILSALDILGQLLGEPVSRVSRLQPPNQRSDGSA